MKKFFLVLVSVLAINSFVMASEDKPIAVERMPQKAQQFIKSHFGNHQVAMAKVETDFLSKSYDVIFTNGDKVEFDGKGEWTNVDCEYSAVPVAVIPAAIKAYVDKHYPDAKVKQIEKDRREYDVELTNGWDIKFDKSFRVVELDK